MKEFFRLLFKFDLKALFLSPTENGFLKFFRYCFVGGIAFVVDYGAFALTFWILGDNALSKIAATTAGFLLGIVTNFLLSKKFVFTEDARTGGKKSEFFWYTVIGVIGLGLNYLLLFLLTGWVVSINPYIAKLIVALIVLMYNYFARKIFLY